MRQYEQVIAKFNPKRIDDLDMNVRQFVGRIMTWQSVWIIEDGEYAGQWAMQLQQWPYLWAPECDLEIQ